MVERFGYEADGWGVGELWSSGDVVVWHERPARAGEIGGDHPLVDRVRSYFRGARESFADVELDLAWCTPVQRHALGSYGSLGVGYKRRLLELEGVVL